MSKINHKLFILKAMVGTFLNGQKQAKMVRKIGRYLETLKLCGVFLAGWIAAHQWMVHQESPTNILSNHIHQFRSGTTSKDINTQQQHTPPSCSPSSTHSSISYPIVKEQILLDSPSFIFSDRKLSSRQKPSWHRLIDCSIYALSECFIAPLEYEAYPTFDILPPLRGRG